jgi:hypothetical protein
MLHIFSTNRAKLVARKPKATNIMGRREYSSVLYVRPAEPPHTVFLALFLKLPCHEMK